MVATVAKVRHPEINPASTDGRAADANAVKPTYSLSRRALQQSCELIGSKRPPVLEIVEFLWGQEGMLDGHECLIVAEWLEGNVDDTDRCRVRPV
jgi:hypothetical protein